LSLEFVLMKKAPVQNLNWIQSFNNFFGEFNFCLHAGSMTHRLSRGHSAFLASVLTEHGLSNRLFAWRLPRVRRVVEVPLYRAALLLGNFLILLRLQTRNVSLQ
jgi:hypothetical protein